MSTGKPSLLSQLRSVVIAVCIVTSLPRSAAMRAGADVDTWHVLSAHTSPGAAQQTEDGEWVAAAGLPRGHNGGYKERLVGPAAGKRPHILLILMDDFGWANAGWHRNYTAPGGQYVPPTPEVSTPNLDALVAAGLELDRNYVYKYCSPTRSALQSGRNPVHVNPLNGKVDLYNPRDPVSGFAGIPRNMTGLATKMAAAGYRTAMVGKWDAGMGTADHTPRGRGYQSALSYFHHSNDYWSMVVNHCPRPPPPPPPAHPGSAGGAGLSKPLPPGDEWVVDLWRAEEGGGEGPARGLNGSCAAQAHPDGGGPPAGCGAGALNPDPWWGGYEDALLAQEAQRVVEAHDPQQPLFLFWAPHIAHTPMQVPESVLERFSFMAPTDQPWHNRQLYSAMVAFADEAVGNVSAALRRKGMWDDLLVVFSADNGGPIYWNASANNFPLKGGKMSNWEGGVRASGFVSGGFLPAAQRGRRFDGLVTAWDWYATLCALAGVDPTDHRAAAAGLPPIDSLDLSGVIMGTNSSGPRRRVALGTEPRSSDLSTAPLCSAYGLASGEAYYDEEWLRGEAVEDAEPAARCTTVDGLIVDEGEGGGLWKLLTGTVPQDVWTGPAFPNRSTGGFNALHFARECGRGCLYELRGDPLERRDLAAALPRRAAAMRRELEALEATAFNPARGNSSALACQAAFAKYGGFWGPFVD